MNKPALSGTAGLLDPVLINLAREIAKKIPSNSLLRSKFIESLMGAARGFLEAHTENLPMLSSVVSEKAIDVWEFVSAFLAKDKSNNANPETEIISSIAERLRKAEDPKKETEKIKEELQLIKEIMDIAHPKIESTSPVLESFNKKLEELRDRIKN